MLTALVTLGWQRAAMALALGYLLGSIPFGLIFSWLAGAGDVRKIGSGNIGATNVLRTGKRWAAFATLVCDAGKGALAVLLASAIFGFAAGAVAGFGAFLGHLFPVWLKFRGGKGVATFFGVTLALVWQVGLAGLATWLAVAALTRMSSLAALVAAVLVPIYMMLFHQPLLVLLEIVLAVFIIAMHRENICRIVSGREPRIGAASESKPA
jgi:glycerol-3-phosphate acyltransferase PlsY